MRSCTIVTSPGGLTGSSRTAGRDRDRQSSAIARAISALVAGSGILNLLSLMGGPVPAVEPMFLRGMFPLDFVGSSPTLTLISGFALILAAAHLWVRKRRAWQVTLVLAGASLGFHLTKGLDFEKASCSAAILMLLWLIRRTFVVGSERPQLLIAVLRAAYAFGIASAYGVAGFWLLEPAEFHRNFHWWDAGLRTIRLMLFLGDESLVPRTQYAAWFLDSLVWMSAAAFLYGGFVLFRPVVYRFRLNQRESELARTIASQYGRSGQDFFKLWPDKSYFFSGSRSSFVGYRVAGNYALVLGDPVGPLSDLQSTIREFTAFCQQRGWRVGFHQVSAEHLATYRKLGFHPLKVGDDAVVELDKFSLSGSAMKEFRNTVKRLDRLGYRVERVEPPVTDSLLAELKQISDRWLELPGHRERRFTLGRFASWYVQATTLYVAFDSNNRAAAFLNLVPSYDPYVATVDLMRRRPDGPSGLMDYVFAKVFLDLKPRGIRYFNLGMAPLTGAPEVAAQSWEERAVSWTMNRLPFLFRADSLRRFKGKYADSWEPRYAVYQSRLDLPRLGMALRRICELPADELEKAA